MTQPGEDLTRPRHIGPGWWLTQGASLVVHLVLMVALSYALMVLTRMLVEGTTDPDPHRVTFWVWLVLCIGVIVLPRGWATWRELADEHVHVEASGQELRIDRWSPLEERQRFVEAVARGGRASRAPEPAAATPSRREVRPRPAPARAAVRRDGLPDAPIRVGRWTGPLRLLHRVALVCLLGWLPLSLVLLVVAAGIMGIDEPRWIVWAFVLLPIGWVLMEVHYLLQHRWQRVLQTRRDLASWHIVTAFVAAVLLAFLALFGLIERDDYLGVTLISIPLAALSIWVLRRELRYSAEELDEPRAR